MDEDCTGWTYDPRIPRQSSGRVPPVLVPHVKPFRFVGETAPIAVCDRSALPCNGAWMAPGSFSGLKPPW